MDPVSHEREVKFDPRDKQIHGVKSPIRFEKRVYLPKTYSKPAENRVFARSAGL
jgi:hypothetical protein